jgi:prolipoprotein diacylglyceryltransferase
LADGRSASGLVICGHALLQGFFRPGREIFRRPSVRRSYREIEMTDVYSLLIAAACFAFVYLFLWLLERI